MRITIDYIDGERYSFNAEKITLVSKSSVIFTVLAKEWDIKTLFHYQKLGLIREFQTIFDTYLITIDANLVTEESLI